MRPAPASPRRPGRWPLALLVMFVTAVALPDVAVAEAGPSTHDGPGFKVGEWQLQVVPWRARRLAGGPIMPARTSGPQDAKGVPLRRLGPGRQLVYNPTVLAQQGLKRLDSWRRTGLRVHLRHARAIKSVLESQAQTRAGRRWQLHHYDRPGQGLKSPWVNANSHGLTLSFLSRFYELEGGARKLAAAEKLVAAFERRPRHRLWFSMLRNHRVWFEHWPGGRQRQVLNSHINAVLGLYDYWLVSRSERAERYLQGGLATVRGTLRHFRRPGRLSRYGIASPTSSLHYHRTHIDQLKALARISGDPWFRRQARRFRSDERAWLERSTATRTP